jgi:hypothetical protein
MSDSESPRLPGPSRGFFRQTALQVKLVWRLMRDRRVNPLLKLLPVATVVYLLFPDILPGPIDDAAVVLHRLGRGGVVGQGVEGQELAALLVR